MFTRRITTNYAESPQFSFVLHKALADASFTLSSEFLDYMVNQCQFVLWDRDNANALPKESPKELPGKPLEDKL